MASVVTAVGVGLDDHAILSSSKCGWNVPGAPPDQQVERALGRLELVAGVLLGHHFGQDLLQQLLVVLHVVLGGHGRDRRAARKLAHQDPPLVAHGLRDRCARSWRRTRADAADVHSALVGEGAAADERLPRRKFMLTIS